MYTNKTPQFKCPQTNDLYTTKTSTKGNKALDYPIGLISADEVAYAGGSYGKANKEYYLAGVSFFAISAYQSSITAVVWSVNDNGGMGGARVDTGNGTTKRGARPVINLKSDVEITSGNGTLSSPYVIKTN